MKRFFAAVLTCALSAAAPRAGAEPLRGPIGDAAGPNWHASFMDIRPALDLKRGTRLTIKLVGQAQFVIVRLLPAEASPETPTGIVGGKVRVPPGGVVEVVLTDDRPAVRQISVHASDEAWGMPLARGNGVARIAAVEVTR